MDKRRSGAGSAADEDDDVKSSSEDNDTIDMKDTDVSTEEPMLSPCS